MEYKIKSEKTINDSLIADIVITAIESGHDGIGYWCGHAEAVERDQKGDWKALVGPAYGEYVVDGIGPYANEEFWHNDSRGYRLTDSEEGAVIQKVLTASAIVKALHYQPPQVKGQSNNWYRKTVDRILDEQYDANDVDAVVQIAVLGEVVYG
jgi:hypothetical protein